MSSEEEDEFNDSSSHGDQFSPAVSDYESESSASNGKSLPQFSSEEENSEDSDSSDGTQSKPLRYENPFFHSDLTTTGDDLKNTSNEEEETSVPHPEGLTVEALVDEPTSVTDPSQSINILNSPGEEGRIARLQWIQKRREREKCTGDMSALSSDSFSSTPSRSKLGSSPAPPSSKSGSSSTPSSRSKLGSSPIPLSSKSGNSSTPSSGRKLGSSPIPPSSKSGSSSTPSSGRKLGSSPIPPSLKPGSSSTPSSRCKLGSSPIPPSSKPGSSSTPSSRSKLASSPIPPSLKPGSSSTPSSRSKLGSSPIPPSSKPGSSSTPSSRSKLQKSPTPPSSKPRILSRSLVGCTITPPGQLGSSFTLLSRKPGSPSTPSSRNSMESASTSPSSKQRSSSSHPSSNLGCSSTPSSRSKSGSSTTDSTNKSDFVPISSSNKSKCLHNTSSKKSLPSSALRNWLLKGNPNEARKEKTKLNNNLVDKIDEVLEIEDLENNVVQGHLVKRDTKEAAIDEVVLKAKDCENNETAKNDEKQSDKVKKLKGRKASSEKIDNAAKVNDKKGRKRKAEGKIEEELENEVNVELDDNSEEEGPASSKQIKIKHDEKWINNLLSRFKTLKRINKDDKILLQCIPCADCYTGQKTTSKKFAWAAGIPDSRTWGRYEEHVYSNTHTTALSTWKRVNEGKEELMKALEAAAHKEREKFNKKKIEENLKCRNVCRNLFVTVRQRQSTRSLYSRFGCQDAHFSDLREAVQAKVDAAKILLETQPTEYRQQEVEQYEKLNDAMPTLMNFVGENQAAGYTDRAVKIRNMKLAFGEIIYEGILDLTINSPIHSFSSDGVADIMNRHSLNLFIQSEISSEMGQTLNFFGRIEYAKRAMNHVGETDLLLHLLNHCLPGFTGYVFTGVLDGPHVHFGDRHSVRVLLKIPLTRDFAHCSALAVTHQTKAIPEIYKIKELLEGVGRDFKNSYQKNMEYRLVFEALHVDLQEFEICPSTRWTYLRKAGLKLLAVIYELILYLENRVERHLAKEENDPAAIGRLRNLKDVTFVADLHVTMDILEPVIALNTKNQGRNRLICEKRHDVDIVVRRLEALKNISGPLERQLLEQIDFSDDYPKMNYEHGVVEMRKLPGHVVRGTRAAGQGEDITERTSLKKYLSEFKRRACSKFQEEIRQCLNKDDLANSFGVLDILHMPIVQEHEDGWDVEYGKEDLQHLANHFGNQFWVLRSFKDLTSKNGFMVKPVLSEPVLDKGELPLEFAAARGEIVRKYRAAVLKGDKLTNMFESDEIDENRGEKTTFTQRRAYEDFVETHSASGEYPNLTVLVRHLLAHIPNSVDPERNASNLKATLTKQRNRMEYDTLNSEMQITENGPPSFSESSEKLINKVAASVLEGGYSAADFRPQLKHMKNVH